MSYAGRHGFGQVDASASASGSLRFSGGGAPPPAPDVTTAAEALAPTPNVTPIPPVPPPPPVSLSITPPACAELMKTSVLSSTLAPETVAVFAFPTVIATDAQMASLFAQILGNPVGTGGAALVQTLTSYTGVHLSFVTAGFMRDVDAPAGKSQGIFWVAVAAKDQQTTAIVAKFCMALVKAAALGAGFALTATGLKSGAAYIDSMTGTGQRAADKSDPALQAAATQSAIDLYKVAGFFGELLTGTTRRITMPARVATLDVTSKATSVQGALQVLTNINAIKTGVEAAVAGALGSTAALQADPAQAAQVVTQLQGAKADLGRMRETLVAGATAAPEIRDRSGPARNDTVTQIRDAVIAGVEGAFAGQPALVREVGKCQFLAQAERTQLRPLIAQLETALNAAQNDAAALIAASAQIAQALAVIDQLQEKLDFAIAQVPLSALERTYYGLPGWAWGLGGATIFVGVLMLVRSKRKRAAAKAGVGTTSAVVTKNPRHRRRRRAR